MSELRMEKLSMESVDFTKENIEKIKELFPQVVTEGKIDFDVLKEILGEQIESRNERYQFTWNGKSDSIRFAQRPSAGTLRPDKESSKYWDSTENLYIEGDNLEVLKLLQKSYQNKIKMIYIDPPYNTGGDFVYKDNFKDSIKNYKEQTNQTLRANPETNGRYHTDWLNMIYPRLMLAKNLLSEDGVILTSIDYNENFNLRTILNEVFGENTFVGEIYWESKTKSQNTSTSFNKLQPKAEMIFMFSKQEKTRFNLIKVGDKEYPFSDEKGAYREYVLEVMNSGGVRGRESMIFEISDGFSKVTPPKGKQWKLGIDQITTYKENGDLFVKHGKVIIRMRPENERTETLEPFWGFFSKEIGTSESAKKDLKTLIGDHGFETVKPLEIIRRLIYHSTNKNDLILDFFSGSSTTAHAVLQLNAEDGGNRKFIMVQLPEKTDEKSEAFKAGYENICEIGKERIRRAGDKIKNELIEKRNKQGMIEDTIDPEQLDIGFKVFKLDTSNLKTFDSTSKNLENIFSEDVFLPERSSLDILYEILLKYGVFDKPVDVIQINGKEAFSIAMNQTIVYINQTITESDVLAIAKLAPREVIFDERGFVNDNDKINAMKRLETAGVEKVATI